MRLAKERESRSVR